MFKILEATFATDIKAGDFVAFLNRNWEVVSTAGTMPGNVAVELRAFDNGEKVTVWK